MFHNDVHFVGFFRHNAMHVATQSGNLHVVRMIISLMRSPEFMERCYGSPVQLEMKAAHMLDLFLNLPDKVGHNTPLHFAAKNGHLDVVRELTSCKQCVRKPLNA